MRTLNIQNNKYTKSSNVIGFFKLQGKKTLQKLFKNGAEKREREASGKGKGS